MLRWAVIFLVIALVAALFGFTGIASAAAGIAKFLFFLFLVICLIFFIIAISAGRRTLWRFQAVSQQDSRRTNRSEPVLRRQ